MNCAANVRLAAILTNIFKSVNPLKVSKLVQE